MKKRILAIFLLAAILLSLAPSAIAEEAPTTESVGAIHESPDQKESLLLDKKLTDEVSRICPTG